MRCRLRVSTQWLSPLPFQYWCKQLQEASHFCGQGVNPSPCRIVRHGVVEAGSNRGRPVSGRGCLDVAGAAEAEGGAVFRRGGEADLSFQVALSQQFDAVGAQTPARPLGGEGALEDLQLYFLGHAAVVMNPEVQVVVGLLAADADHTLRRGGLDGILGHVDQDAVQQPRVGEKIRCHGIGADFHPAGPAVVDIVVKGNHLLKQGKACAGFALQVQIVVLRRGQGGLRLDLIGQSMRIAVQNILKLPLLFFIQFFLAEGSAHAHHAGGNIGHIVEEDALQGPSSFFMGDIGEKEEVEIVVSAGKRRGLHPEVKGLAAALLSDPAFLGITVFRLVQEKRGRGFGCAAGGTEDGGAAAQNTLHCMLAGQGVPGFFPQHLGKGCGAKKMQKSLVGKNNLPGMIENQDKAGEGIENVQQLTVVADGFAQGFDFNPRAARLLGCFGRTEVFVHVWRQGLLLVGFWLRRYCAGLVRC